MSYATWDEPGYPTNIEYSLAGMEAVRRQAVDGLLSLPRIGLGVGGILVGDPPASGKPLRIESSLEIACSHGDGPTFSLTPEEFDAARELAGETRRHAVVGVYITKTRGGLIPTPEDIRIFRELCPEIWQVLLILRPSSVRPTRICVCFADQRGIVTHGMERDLDQWVSPDEMEAMEAAALPEPASLAPEPLAKRMFAEPPKEYKAKPVTNDAPPVQKGPRVAFAEKLKPAAPPRSQELAPNAEPVQGIKVRFRKQPPPVAPETPQKPRDIQPATASKGPRVRFAEKQPEAVKTERPEVPLSAPAKGPSVRFMTEPPPVAPVRSPEERVAKEPEAPKSWFVDELPPPVERKPVEAADPGPVDPEDPFGFRARRASMLIPEEPGAEPRPVVAPVVRESVPLSPEEAIAAANSQPTEGAGFEAVSRIKLVPAKPKAAMPAASPEDYFYVPPVQGPASPLKKWFLAGLAVASLAAVGYVTSSQWLPQSLKLDLSDSGGHVTAVWNADAVPKGSSGQLTIMDGPETRTLPVNAAQIAAGVIGFDRKTNAISVTLKVGDDAANAVYRVPNTLAPPPESAKPGAEPASKK